MSIVTCPKCSARLRLPPGTRAACPRCRAAIPARPPAGESPAPPDDGGPPVARTGRRSLVLAGVVGLVVLLAGGGVAGWFFLRAPAEAETAPAAAASAPAGPKAALTPEEVNRRLLHSAAFVIRDDPRRRDVGLGSGVLVHGGRRLVVTNYHVVQTAPQVVVFFPARDPNGDLITDPKHYVTNAEKLGRLAKVIARDTARDLAVLELEKMPDQVVGLPLADQPAATGAAVYSIGASGVGGGAGGAFWRFSSGTVRGRHRETFRVSGGQQISAMILETQKPVNPGDSGGPTVNDRGELVGVVASFDRGQNLVMQDIDVTEVRAFLEKTAKDGGWAWDDRDAAPPTGLAPRPADPAAPPPSDPKADLLADARGADPGKRLEAFRRLGAQGAAARWAVPVLLTGLDDADERARRMAATALEQVGPPAPEDAGCLAAAAKGDRRHARLHALRHFGAAEKAGRDLLPAVAAALDAPDAETREAAALALGFFGPDAKSAALAKLFNRAADPDPAVARAVGRVLVAFGPYAGADRAPLTAALSGTDPARRYTALRLLTAGAGDPAAVVELARPRLTDAAPPVRELAARVVGAGGPAARAAAPELVGLLADADPRVRAAAVWAVGEVGGAPGAVPALGKLLTADDPLERSAAARALVRVGVTDPADAPVLLALLATDDPAARAAALESAARLRPVAPELVTAAADALPAADAGVRLAALKVLTAAGPAAARHSAKAFDALAAPPPMPPMPPTPPAPPAGEQLVERVTRSAAWVLAERYGRGVASGSGTLVDGPNRLVVTNYHVVEGGESFVVFFPARVNGAVSSRPADYLNRRSALARTRHLATARVVATDPRSDLAVLRLDAAPPDDALPLPVAAAPAKAGQALHTVGASGVGLERGDGVLWRYTAGKARAVYDHRMILDGVQEVACTVVETDMPINRGDSGSAAVNDAGELVGVNFGAHARDRALSYAVDAAAVRRLVARVGSRSSGGEIVAVPGPAVPAPPPPPPADAAREEAAAALAAMGPGTADLLVRGLAANPPPAAAARLVAALGATGKDLPRDAVGVILTAAEKTPAARPAATKVLAKVGGDDLSLFLRQRTEWSAVGPAGAKTKKGRYPNDVAVWAVNTLAEFDPAKLSDRGRDHLLTTLEGLAERDLDPAGKEAARLALVRLRAAGLRRTGAP